jgi:hypothetical protein
MNKRGLAGRAFTLLTASAIIAMLILGFVLASAAFNTKQSFDVTANIAGLNTAGQLRLVATAVAPEITRGNYDSVAPAVKDAFGPTANFGFFADDVLVAGTGVKEPDATFAATLPKYDGKTMDVRIEVKYK